MRNGLRMFSASTILLARGMHLETQAHESMMHLEIQAHASTTPVGSSCSLQVETQKHTSTKTVSLRHCMSASLCLCITVSLRHCLTVSLHRQVTQAHAMQVVDDAICSFFLSLNVMWAAALPRDAAAAKLLIQVVMASPICL